MCIFEASGRIGGRTYSVPPSRLGKPFTLDVGAYRFTPDMHLPGDLILNHLKLPTECYEPACPSAKDDFPKPFMFNYSAPLRRVIDPKSGLPAGYATPLHVMVERMRVLGVRIFLDSPLLDITPPSVSGGAAPALSQTKLQFANGTATASGAVMLNLPRNRLMMLSSIRSSLPKRTAAMLDCVKFDAPPDMFGNQSIANSTALSKAYFYYEDAWWHTRLNLTTGEYPANAFHPLVTSYGIDIGVHWNDGPVTCTSADGRSFRARGPVGAGVKCHGYLLAYYSATNDTFFYGLSGAPSEPLGVVDASPPYAHEKLEMAHAALLEAIQPLLKAKAVPPASLPPMSSMAVGVWSRPGGLSHDEGYTAPTKVYWAPSISGDLGRACSVDGLSEDEYRATALQPFGEGPVYMANNDWVAQDVHFFFGDWAEESLVQCERALYKLGMARPDWLNETYYKAKIVDLA